MKIRVSTQSIWDNLFFLLFFLIGLFYKNIPQYFLALAGILLIINLINRKIWFLPVEFYILSFSFVVYFSIQSDRVITLGGHQYIVWLWGPMIGYLIGYYFLKGRQDRYVVGRKIITAFLLGSVLYVVLCTIYKFTNIELYKRLFAEHNFFVTMYDRYLLGFWNNQPISPTNINSYVLIPILLIFYTIQYLQDKKLKFIYYVAFVVSILTIFTTATRTNILMLLISLLLGFFLSKNDLRLEIRKKEIIWILLCILLLVIFSNTIIGYVLDFMSLRQESLDNNRWNSVVLVLNNLEKYPFGGMPYSFAHNIWVDIAREAGLIPMISLLVYSLSSLFVGIKYIKTASIPQDARVYYGLLFLGLFISFLFEPVISGRPFNFIVYCMVNGMIRSFLKESRKEFEEM